MCKDPPVKMQSLESELEQSGSGPALAAQDSKASNKCRKLNSVYHLEQDETGATVFRLAHTYNMLESSEQNNTVPEIILVDQHQVADNIQSIEDEEEEEERPYPKEAIPLPLRVVNNKKQNTRSDVFELRIENIRERLLQGDFACKAERTQLEQSLGRFERAKQKRERHLHNSMNNA
mmetsp:Transcript_1492/g.2473  ORF Transcript_1492/g.2473 Transcript_1492/m.2473 type:complete len:177 (+) Transcript_1492:29-559(+)|eukprot:CAMPEP_0184700104 /NCGR_PEP_ID=MMETSP0313-20130426/8676_1 /TAXON_ID=2792 /ORGANISM="Porphyridium aerugineum, Strain SAG 1380-2" /LENGTH=176 /DNA_ID=CAMNT_0027159509 /DNA_START=23 /DNA_END=553 /DNA_ORIENTATION=-